MFVHGRQCHCICTESLTLGPSPRSGKSSRSPLKLEILARDGKRREFLIPCSDQTSHWHLRIPFAVADASGLKS